MSFQQLCVIISYPINEIIIEYVFWTMYLYIYAVAFMHYTDTYYDIHIYMYILRFYINHINEAKSSQPINQQTAFKDLSSNNYIGIKDADKEGAIAIIKDYIADYNTLLCDNSTYHRTSVDVMEAHYRNRSILNNLTIANKQHVVKLLTTKLKPGLFFVLSKLHRLKQLISTKFNHFHLKKTHSLTPDKLHRNQQFWDKTTIQTNCFQQRIIGRTHYRIC